MATLGETETYEPGIYQLEITDPVIGGPDGIDNLQAKQLANRTNWLKAKIDSLLGFSVIHTATLKATPADADEFGFLSSSAAWSLVKMTGTNLKAWLKTYFDTVYAVLNSPAFTGTPTAPTATTGTDTTQLATTEFMMSKSGALSTLKLLHIQDQRANGTSGGASSTGWNTRVLNTVITNTISGTSLGSNQITLPAGTYFIEGVSGAYNANRHKLRLFNVTDASVAMVGTSENEAAGQTNSSISGVITIALNKTFEVRHYFETSNANGLGVAVSSGDVEVYSDIKIWKVA